MSEPPLYEVQGRPNGKKPSVLDHGGATVFAGDLSASPDAFLHATALFGAAPVFSPGEENAAEWTPWRPLQRRGVARK